MTATNHGLAGALIGLAVTQPAIALPLAFASHFALDSVPHFGIQFYESEKKKKLFHRYLLVDALLLSILIISLYLAGAGWLVFACLFLAGCPDFVQAYKYIFQPKFRAHPTQEHWFTRFHKNIQKSETEKGIFIEAPLAVVFSLLIAYLL